MNTSIDNILELVSNIKYKEIKQKLFKVSILYSVYNSGVTSIWGQKDFPLIATVEQSHMLFHILTG